MNGLKTLNRFIEFVSLEDSQMFRLRSPQAILFNPRDWFLPTENSTRILSAMERLRGIMKSNSVKFKAIWCAETIAAPNFAISKEIMAKIEHSTESESPMGLPKARNCPIDFQIFL